MMGICNKIAGAIAPIALGAVTLKDADAVIRHQAKIDQVQKIIELDALARRVILPYIAIIMVLFILGILIYKSKLPEVDLNNEDKYTGEVNTKRTSIFQFPHLLLGVLALFLYVGVEVLAGDTIINYAAFHGISLAKAKFFPTCTLLAMCTGYIIGILCIPKYIQQDKALKMAAMLGVLNSVTAIFVHGYISVLFIALLGLANSLMWPAIWPLAIAGLGRFTKVGSSLLIMAIAGGALIPLLYGRLADLINPQQAYWILVPCYLFIWYYAASGHKRKQHRAI
jgi:FHS family L-fucose permease-like MFS transporter